MKKVLYLTRVNISANSAQGKQVREMSRAFHSRGGGFKLVAPGNKEDKMDFPWKNVAAQSRFLLYFKLLREVVLSRFQGDVSIFTRDIAVSFFAILLGGSSMYESHKPPNNNIAKNMLLYLKRSKRFKLLTISHSLGKYYLKEMGYSSVLTCHDGVNMSLYERLHKQHKNDMRAELDLPPSRLVVVHTGGLHKGDDPKTFEAIVRKFPDVLFVQVGGAERDVIKYKHYYRHYNNILFVPYQSDSVVAKYQMSADVLFYALTKSNKLWKYTSPLKLFEYMATRRPILASDIGSVSEILNAGNAVIYKPELEDSIVKGLEFIMQNKQHCAELSERAYKEVKESYQWKHRASYILGNLP